jgi:hypothetical protein
MVKNSFRNAGGRGGCFYWRSMSKANLLLHPFGVSMITFKLPEFRSDGGNFLSRFILCPFRIRTRPTAGFVFPGMARHVQVASMVLSPRSDRVLGLPEKRRCTAQRNALQNIGSIVRSGRACPHDRCRPGLDGRCVAASGTNLRPYLILFARSAPIGS